MLHRQRMVFRRCSCGSSSSTIRKGGEVALMLLLMMLLLMLSMWVATVKVGGLDGLLAVVPSA